MQTPTLPDTRARTHTHTHRQNFNIYCFSTATSILECASVTLYVQCLVCYLFRIWCIFCNFNWCSFGRSTTPTFFLCQTLQYLCLLGGGGRMNKLAAPCCWHTRGFMFHDSEELARARFLPEYAGWKVAMHVQSYPKVNPCKQSVHVSLDAVRHRSLLGFHRDIKHVLCLPLNKLPFLTKHSFSFSEY
jgi:hypothetical protein